MPTNELLEKYKEEICPTCINRKLNLCKITIHQDNKTREANCDFYEKE